MRHLTPLVFVLIPAEIPAMEPWHAVSSPDGSVEALIPGPAEETFKETESLAGVMITSNLMFQGNGEEYTISSTPLKPLVLKFVKTTKIFRDAKLTVLRKSVARETSCTETTVNGVPAQLLRYDSLEQDDASDARYHGLAIMFLHRKTLYIADAVIPRVAGEGPLMRFRDSIVVHNTEMSSPDSVLLAPVTTNRTAAPDPSPSGG